MGGIGSVNAVFTADTRGFDVSVEGTGQQLKAAAQMADQAAVTIASAGEKIDRTAALQERAAERARRAWERELLVQNRAIDADQEAARAKELAALKADILARSLEEESVQQTRVAAATEHSTGKVHEARGAMALLGEETGIKLPRHVRSFLADLPLVETAMSAAFGATAIVAIGVALVEAGKKLYEFGEHATELSEHLGTNWLQGAIYQLTGVADQIKHLDEEITGFDRDIDSILNKRKEQTVEDTRAKEGPMAAANLEAASLQARALGNDEIIKGLRARLQLEQQIAAIPGVGKGPIQPGQFTREQEQRRQARAAGVPTDSILAAAASEKTQKEIERYSLEADQLRQDAERKIRDAAKKEAEENQRAARENARGAGATASTANPYAAIDRPNTSMFYTPIYDAIKATRSEDKADRDAGAKADQDRAQLLFDTWIKQMQALQTKVAIDSMPGAVPPNVELAKQLPPAIQGAKQGLEELARAFNDTAGMLRDLVVKSVNDFNSTAVGKMFGDKGASWGSMFSDIGHSLAKSGLQKLEGTVLGGMGFGKHDGSSAQSPLYVIDVSGAPGTAVPGAGGLMSMLNNSDWASSLFGGKLFGSGSFFGHFAEGGEIPSNMPSIVGERGPELFMPHSAGRIVPNNRMFGGGGQTWNIDARGTDPALTRENFARALAMTHRQAVSDASRIMQDRSRRVPR